MFLISALAPGAVACGSSDDPQDPLELRTLDVNLSEVNDSGYEGQLVIVSTDDGRSIRLERKEAQLAQKYHGEETIITAAFK